MDISNIKPILESGFKNPIKGGLILTLTNIIPTFTILSIPKTKVINYNKSSKYLFITYTLSFILIFLIAIKTISVLGIYLTSAYQYPEYIVLKKISLLDFFDKIENIIFIKWILTSFCSLSIMIYYLTNSIKKDNKKKLIPTIITLIIIFLSISHFKNNTIFTNFIENIYPYTNLLLLFIIIIISINIFIKNLNK
jgi:spore germination protein KB